MNPESCFELGHILKAHGIMGEVQAVLDVDIPEEYIELESVFVEINQKLIPFFIEDLKLFKGKKALIKFEDVDSVQDAEELQWKKLFLPLKFLPKLEQGKFYYHEIIDYLVVDQKAGQLGKIREVAEAPGQDLIFMEYEGKEVLIPITDEVVLKADHEAKELHVDLPEGLLDIYLNP